MPLLGEAMALSAAMVWACSVILFKHSSATAGPQAINLFKNVVALGLLTATLLVLGVPVPADRPLSDWALLIGSGVLGIAVADTLVLSALRRIGPAVLAIVDLIYAPSVVLLSMLVLGERPGGAFALGALLVLGGVVGAIWPRRGRVPMPGDADLRTGALLGAAGLVTMGVGVVMAKPILEQSHLVEVTTVRIVAGIVAQLLWFATFSRETSWTAAFRPGPLWRSLLPASVLGSYVAMLLWVGGFKYTDASIASVLNQMSTVFTILLARVFLGERLRPQQVIGGVVALTGALVILLG